MATTASLATLYPVCSRFLKKEPHLRDGEELPEFLANNPHLYRQKPWLAEACLIERARLLVAGKPSPEPEHDLTGYALNPTLELLPVHWLRLPDFLDNPSVKPRKKPGYVLVWKTPAGRLHCRDCHDQDLLLLKITAEDLPLRTVATTAKTTVGTLYGLLHEAVNQGLILGPRSRLVRPPTWQTAGQQEYLTAPAFTLQWHITQTCDLHCRHCYDRTKRQQVTLDQGIRILDNLLDFTRKHGVFTQISFSGGNPMLHPDFLTLYQEASERGFQLAILGNPMPAQRIEEILAIQKPEFYQVSLEGLQEHNDYIRGNGHFQRVLRFLDLLKKLDIYSMVMLTLTRANMDEVMPLAEKLNGRVDLFTFNRLAMVGEGATLASVEPSAFVTFLRSYEQAATANPCMGYKDNFFNLLRFRDGRPLLGGCTGFGCGAAFNFLSLLPDGEVHACRKLPSLIGNIFTDSLETIYHSSQAEQYRQGPAECRGCPIEVVCRGCLAVSYGFGQDIFTQKDPYCFFKAASTP